MTISRQERVAVIGVDFSPSSDEAIYWGLRWLAEVPTRTLHLFHVLDPRDVIDDIEVPALVTTERVLAEAPSAMAQRVEVLSATHRIPAPREQVRYHARVGRAVETLLQACVDYEADVLVVGTHGRKGMERLLLGSVAEQLVRTARCAVVIARCPDYRGCEKTALPEAPYAKDDPRNHPSSQRPHEAIVSTESTGWTASDTAPTGMRIV